MAAEPRRAAPVTGDSLASPRPRSVAAIKALEQRQQEEGSRSGLLRDPATDAAALREIAQRQLMAERLDGIASGSITDHSEALIALVGDPGYQRAVDSRVRLITDLLADSDGDLWSRYERPDHRRRLAMLVTNVERAALALGYRVEQRPVVGTLDTGDVNAQALPGPPGEGHIVVFDSGMFRFCAMAAAVAVQALDLRFTDDGRALHVNAPDALAGHLAARPGVIVQFADMVFSQATLGTCLLSGVYPLAVEYKGLGEAFANAIETFVLAHEYGHLVLGHIDLPAVRGESADPHTLEFEADRIGLAIAAEAVGAGHWALVGSAIFLIAVETLGRATSTFVSGLESVPVSDTHPDPRARLGRLVAALPAFVDPRLAPFIERLVESIALAYERLWAFCRPAFERGHREGYPPADFSPAASTNSRRRSTPSCRLASLRLPRPAHSVVGLADAPAEQRVSEGPAYA